MNKKHEGQAPKSAQSAPDAAEFQDLPIQMIDECDHFRTRRRPYSGLHQLAASIKRLGQLNPLSVRKRGDRYELIAGYRRLTALKLLEASLAHCRVYSGISDDDAYALAISENERRTPLTELELARARAQLKTMLGDG